MLQCSPGELTDVLQNNHRDFSNSGTWALGAQWMQTNHRDFNPSTYALDVQLCPQVTLGSGEPIKGLQNLPALWDNWVQLLGWEDSLQKGMATHSSNLAWRTPWTI